MPFDLDSNPELETLDEVPEDYRGFYEESDGKFVLSGDERITGMRGLVTGLDKALTASRKEATNYSKRAVDLAPLSDFGDTPATILEAMNDRIKEIQKEAAGGKVDTEKMKASMEAAHAKKLIPYDTRISSLSGQLERLLVENVAAEAIGKAKGSAKLLMPHIKDQVMCKEETDSEGKDVFKVYVRDRDGAKRFSGTAAAEYMTIAELVDEMKADKEFGRMFESEAARGGGAPAGPTRQIPVKREGMSPADKIAFGLKKKQHEGR